MDMITPLAYRASAPVPPRLELEPPNQQAFCATRVANAQTALRPDYRSILDSDIERPEPWSVGRPVDMQRRQLAILAGDVVGYSRMIENDDVGTVARLRFLRRALLDPTAALFHAALIRHTADAILFAFEKPADALGCAITLQSAMFLLNEHKPEGRRIRLRVGLSVGDVLLVDDDVHGTGVNIAARLEALAGAGEIYLCERAVEHVRHVLPIAPEPIGERRLHNISRPVRIFRVAGAVIASIAHQRALPAGNEFPVC
jgi:adenylate cyclase